MREMAPTELPVKRGWSSAPRRLLPRFHRPALLKALLQVHRPLARRRPARHVHAYRSNADNSIDSYVDTSRDPAA